MPESDYADTARKYLDRLEWLSQFFQRHIASPEMVPEELAYAQALVRNYLLRCCRLNAPNVFHVAVIGGGGAGKSTVVNILLGENLAETNPQAGYTRHPTAFVEQPDQALSLLAKLRSASGPIPGDVDQDLYDVRLRTNPGVPSELVVWDNPDVTTIHAANYVHRLLEVVALADGVIYVASAQRYNDRVPSQYIAMLARSGKPMIACLTKVPERDIESVRNHFIEVLHAVTHGTTIPCIVIPYLSLEQLNNAEITRPYQQQLLDSIAPWLTALGQLRKNNCRQALSYLEYLESRWQGLVQPELESLRDWHRLVDSQRTAVVARYREEFMDQERLAIFDEAMVRLIDLLEMPGIGQWVSWGLNVLRLPWRGVKWLWGTWGWGTDYPGPLQTERDSLLSATQRALNQLWREAERQQQRSVLWTRLSQVLEPHGHEHAKLLRLLEERFPEYERARRDAIESLARNIYGELEDHPVVLNALRAIKLTLEAGSIAGIIATAGINLWDLVLVPLATSVIQALTEFLGAQYVETHRQRARQEQLQLVSQHVITPTWQALENHPSLADWRTLEQTLLEMPQLRKRLAQAFSDHEATSRIGGR